MRDGVHVRPRAINVEMEAPLARRRRQRTFEVAIARERHARDQRGREFAAWNAARRDKRGAEEAILRASGLRYRRSVPFRGR